MNNQTVNPETLRKRNSKKSETAEKRKSRLNRETELKRQKRAAENEEKRTERRKKDRSKLDKIEIKGCPVCNERIPSMSIVNDMCRRCNKEIGTKKFSKDNNMDPGDVPDELQGLTEVEEMLIAQVFTVMSVYRLS